jgi:hypothetical protein
MGGRRIDHVSAPAYEFLDGRGQWTERGKVASSGSVVMRQKAGGVLEIIDLYGNARIGFAGGDGVLLAYDAEQKPLGRIEITSPRDGWREFNTMAAGRTYIFAPAP